MAASVAGVALLIAAPSAFADTQPSGATASQSAATDPTATQADPPTLGPGTPGDTQQAAAASTEEPSASDASSDTTGSGGTDSSAGTGADSGQASSTDVTDPSASQDSSGDGAGSGDTSIDPGDAPSSSTQSAGAGAQAGQTDTGNGNVSTRVDQGGNNGPVGQSNDAASSASSSAGGNDPSTTGDSTATASAGTTQTDPNNTNVDVRVGSPGNIGSVDQQNNATASAGATAPDSGSGGTANATSTQTNPGNVNVIVRVDSPGNNGSVNQQNTVGATAGSTVPGSTPGGTGAGSGSFGTDQGVSTTSDAGTENDSEVDQTVEQQQDANGDYEWPDGSDPQASNTTGSGTAKATQTGAANTNVSVRIGSPGTDGTVTQGNTATATGSTPDQSIVVKTDGANTNVSIVIPGQANGAPSGAWQWNWIWNGDWTLPPGVSAADVAPTADSIWNWIWSNQPPASGDTTSAGDTTSSGSDTASAGSDTAASTGQWTWTWTWTTASGQTWNWTWNQQCDCNWSWNWTWDWSAGAPASATSAPPAGAGQSTSTNHDQAPQAPAADIGPVTQTNSVEATASADVLANATQLLGQQQDGVDPSLGSLEAQQIFISSQTALAQALAGQAHVKNLNVVWGASTGPVKQSNLVAATATARAEADDVQGIVQKQTGGSSTQQSASAFQWVASSQSAVSTAEAGQANSGNSNIVWAPKANFAHIGQVEQTNTVSASADAEILAYLGQWVGQFQEAGSSSQQGADATQLIANTQSADAQALASQSDVWNVNDVLVPAGSHATNPSLRQQNVATATALASDWNVVLQSILQAQGGASEVETATATQQAASTQTAVAVAEAQQDNLRNRAGWLGVEPSPATPSTPGTTTTVSNATSSTVITTQTGGGTLPAIHPTRERTVVITIYGRGPRLSQAVAAGPRGVPGAGSFLGLTTAGGPAPHATVVKRQEEPAPTSSNDSFTGFAGSGPAGSAPLPGGGGLVGLLARPYKFVAPAHLGPQSSAPDLGRPVAFLDPFERPG
jgi:hypothetical protein